VAVSKYRYDTNCKETGTINLGENKIGL